MFVGAINSIVRKYLASVADVFDDKVVVVGCSGNFTSETVLSTYAKAAEIHSNDVSFYSCMAGYWLTGQPLEFTITDPEFDWLEPYLDTSERRLATIITLLNMLDFEKRNNVHRVRMWNLYRETFGDMVSRTVAKLGEVDCRLTSFFAGDVMKHFERFGNDSRAIFCCYAPTYAGGYERLYRRLDAIMTWDEPAYEMLDDEHRGRLLVWMSQRPFLWYDDRRIEGMKPVMEQRSGWRKTVYLYSNVVKRPAYFGDIKNGDLPKIPLADSNFEITPSSQVRLVQIKTTDLSRFKDAFLGKSIQHTSGMWAFVVIIDQMAVGFIEFQQSQLDISSIYMMADFSVPGTRYKRLSKLMVMLAISGQTRKLIERLRQLRIKELMTTAFTDRPVSMKYRGVLNLLKRGETESGQKFINYGASFNDLSWQETLQAWLTQHGSKIW